MEIFLAGTKGGVFFSSDNGSNWSAVNNGLTDTIINCLTISGSNIFAGTDDGLFLSNDNGTSWSTRSNGFTGYY